VTFRASESTGVPTVSSASPPARRTLQALLFGATGSLLQQFARYLVVGGLAFVVDFGLLYLLTEFAGLHYLISAAIAFLFGLLTNYFLSLLWVFDRRTMENVAMEFVIFTAIGIVGLGLNEVIIWFVREKMHFHYMIGKAISAGIVLIWNFGARKSVLFR
jgi:putative flippase GtrA